MPDKRAKAAAKPRHLSKTAKTEAVTKFPPESTLSWKMASADFGGTWGWKAFASGHVGDLHKILEDYEKTPIRTLQANDRINKIPCADVCDDARSRLEKINRDDLEDLWELRLGKKDWRVLWWDPDHTVCTGDDRGRSRKRWLNTGHR